VISIRAGSRAACAVLSLLVRAHLDRGLERNLWGWQCWLPQPQIIWRQFCLSHLINHDFFRIWLKKRSFCTIPVHQYLPYVERFSITSNKLAHHFTYIISCGENNWLSVFHLKSTHLKQIFLELCPRNFIRAVAKNICFTATLCTFTPVCGPLKEEEIFFFIYLSRKTVFFCLEQNYRKVLELSNKDFTCYVFLILNIL
jgi:hypothetical protein